MCEMCLLKAPHMSYGCKMSPHSRNHPIFCCRGERGKEEEQQEQEQEEEEKEKKDQVIWTNKLMSLR